MKEDMTKVIDTLTQEDFHEAFQNLLEQHNECIAAGEDYFEEDYSFMYVLSIKVPIRKKSGNLSYAPPIVSHYSQYLFHETLNNLGYLMPKSSFKNNSPVTIQHTADVK